VPEDDARQPAAFFDAGFAARLVGRSLLVGLTELDHEGALIRRRQVFGIVTVAERARGICVRSETDGAEFWLPPDTRGINPAEPGEYRNRTTGEVVADPDYTAVWTYTRPRPRN